ncbi:molybdenum ABC transporter ATP-binding protein [Cucumibacter marinus]|uniref:molybdenum ABC transporter ATP-binding protein n=1 Tax=Cucumibacter marinus TaxID=1121252 RepID=UPI0004164668|nr:molybdenum ABC transporter ATP-binding protein [Cucumibacter marinus]
MLEVRLEARKGDTIIDTRFALNRGVTALVGPSGAGKTSILRLIAGLDAPLAGFVKLGDRVLFDDEQDVDIPVNRRGLGMVFQRPLLLPHRNVAANIRLGRRVPKARLIEVASALGIDTLLKRRVGGLSGGEQQRVMLARALVGQPNALLCDEPLTGLDSPRRQALVDVMREALAALDIPVLYVTHAFDEAAELADRLMVLEEGRVVEDGPVAEIAARHGSTRQFEAGVSSLITGEIAARDAEFGLATVAVGDEQIEIADPGLEVGAPVTLRLWAKDLVLAKTRPEGISARNALTGRVKAVKAGAGAEADIAIEAAGTVLMARVMRKTVTEMDLNEGSEVVVLFKSAAPVATKT